MDIILNSKKINFTKNDFPILISGAEKTGASFFSIGLTSNLLREGLKVLFSSAYQAAKEEFKKQTDGQEGVIIIESGEKQSIIKTLKSTPNLSERVVLIKNIENYSPELFNVVKGLKLLIFSGDIDKCHFADSLIKSNLPTKIFFSQSKKFPQKDMANLPEYHARIISNKYRGAITLGTPIN